MGIRDLWTILAPACQERTFTEFTVREGFETSRRPEQCLYIAIDSSIWMSQAQTAVNYRLGPGTRTGENPALRILFFRLCRLSTLPVIPIFVFDGPNHPKMKRGKQVQPGNEHGLATAFRAFIEAFGFHWYMAPGEAEADLAELSQKRIVDAVMTEDVDVFVFGAISVIRMGNARIAGDLISIYTSKAIQNHERILLDREGLFFMAILCSGDYGKGLSGCGSTLALILSRTEFAKSLFVASSTLPSRESLQEFLKKWRAEFKDFLLNDPQGVLGRKHPSLANNINSKFPSVDILLLYARPITSWTMNQVPTFSSWTISQLNLGRIGVLCEKYFSWHSGDNSIVNRFRDNVWPGVAMRFLLSTDSLDDQLQAYCDNQPSPGGCFTTANILRINREKIGPGGPATHSNVRGYVLDVMAATLISATVSGLESIPGSNVNPSNVTKITIWIPAAVMSDVLGTMVQTFRASRQLSTPSPIPYQPVLLPLNIDISSLVGEEGNLFPPSESLPVPGPSNSQLGYKSPLTGHGNSDADPILLSDTEENTTSSVGSGSRVQSSVHAAASDSAGKVFLGYIDLC